MITRFVPRSEVKRNQQARDALVKEFSTLRGKCWDEKARRAKADVIRDAKKRGVEVHFAALYGICGEKGYELPPGDPRRKYKGRCVLLGDRVVNQDFETATFADMGNAHTLLDGARLTDAYGCLPGHQDRKSTRLNSSHIPLSRMPSSA